MARDCCSGRSMPAQHILFFFKQKTAYEIPKRDWSSDVCSSDLDDVLLNVFNFLSPVRILFLEATEVIGVVVMIANGNRQDFLRFLLFDYEPVKIDRKSVV